MIHGFVRRFPFFDQGKAAIEEIGRELLRSTFSERRAMLRPAYRTIGLRHPGQLGHSRRHPAAGAA